MPKAAPGSVVLPVAPIPWAATWSNNSISPLLKLYEAKPASIAFDTKNVLSSEKSNQQAVLPVLFSPDATSKSMATNSPFTICHVDTEPVSYTHLTLPTICSV